MDRNGDFSGVLHTGKRPHKGSEKVQRFSFACRADWGRTNIDHVEWLVGETEKCLGGLFQFLFNPNSRLISFFFHISSIEMTSASEFVISNIET